MTSPRCVGTRPEGSTSPFGVRSLSDQCYSAIGRTVVGRELAGS